MSTKLQTYPKYKPSGIDWLGDIPTDWTVKRNLGRNPFGHSARRIGDFYAGLVGNFTDSSSWKKLRVTPHDHNPINDA